MVDINLFVVFLFVVIPAMILTAYLLGRRPEVKQPESPSPVTARLETNSDKLFHSKTIDDAFFDGESTDYAEVVQRLRQWGGA